MNAPLSAQAFRRAAEDALHTVDATGVQRWEWRHHFGTLVIEVRGVEVFVDGQRVEPVGRPGKPLEALQPAEKG